MWWLIYDIEMDLRRRVSFFIQMLAYLYSLYKVLVGYLLQYILLHIISTLLSEREDKLSSYCSKKRNLLYKQTDYHLKMWSPVGQSLFYTDSVYSIICMYSSITWLTHVLTRTYSLLTHILSYEHSWRTYTYTCILTDGCKWVSKTRNGLWVLQMTSWNVAPVDVCTSRQLYNWSVGQSHLLPKVTCFTSVLT